MVTNKFFIADPYNDNHIKLFEAFEKKNDRKKTISKHLKEIQKKYDKRLYDKVVLNSNDINETLFDINNDEVDYYTHISGEKDRKVCELFFVGLKDKNKMNKVIKNVTDYALNNLGMEQIFVSTTYEDKIRESLLNNGYEDIGDVNGKDTFLREKIDVKEIGKKL